VGGDRKSFPRLRCVGQHHANLAQQLFLLIGYDEEFKTAAQPVAVANHGANFHQMRWKRNGKIQRNYLTGQQFAAQRGADAILAELVCAAPEGKDMAFAKNRQLNTNIETMAGITTLASLVGPRSLTRLIQADLLRLRFHTYNRLCLNGAAILKASKSMYQRR